MGESVTAERLPCPRCGGVDTLETLSDERAKLEAEWQNLQEKLRPPPALTYFPLGSYSSHTHTVVGTTTGTGGITFSGASSIAIGQGVSVPAYDETKPVDERTFIVKENGKWVPKRSESNLPPVNGQETCVGCGTIYCPTVGQKEAAIRREIQALQKKMILDLIAKAAAEEHEL